jgi:hypothetical protein
MSDFLDLSSLIDLARTWPMSNGWQVMIRAEMRDATPGRPYGISYALILQDEGGQRLLGFDNSHGLDGASANEPFDHEHRAGVAGRAFSYKFTSAGQLVTDFFARCEAYCDEKGVKFEFVVEDVS